MPYIFLLRGVPVHVRRLPSGDLVVWHPFNAAVREFVEPICRGRGYWQARYKNWVVRAHYAEEVCRELALAEVAL